LLDGDQPADTGRHRPAAGCLAVLNNKRKKH
jgi:hypothetical protein